MYVLAEAAPADPLAVHFVIVRKRHTADVPIVTLINVRFSHRAVASRYNVPRINAFPRGNVHGYLYVCAHACNKLLAVELRGVKEGFIFFFTGLSMLRSHILQRTHITITLKSF